MALVLISGNVLTPGCHMQSFSQQYWPTIDLLGRCLRTLGAVVTQEEKNAKVYESLQLPVFIS